MYKLVIFDLDGTILDTIGQLANAMNAALEMSGFPRLDTEFVKNRVGNGSRKLVERCVEGCGEEVVETIIQNYRGWYKEHCIDNTFPYEGIADLLKSLKDNGVKTSVVTNKSDAPAKTLCEHFYPGLFDIVIGHREGLPHKPDPTILKEVFGPLGIDPSEAVVVGDSEVDIELARNAGADFVSVTWGYKSLEILLENGASKIANTADELKGFLL